MESTSYYEGEYAYEEASSHLQVNTGDNSEISGSGSGDSSDAINTEYEQSGDTEVSDNSDLDNIDALEDLDAIVYEENKEDMLALETRKYYHDICQ